MSLPVAHRAARALERHRAQLVGDAVDDEFRRRPDAWARFGPAGRTRCLEDTSFHVSFLVTSLTMGEAKIFVDYVAWLIQLLGSHGIGRDDVERNLRSLCDVAAKVMAADEVAATRALVEEALA